MEEDVFGSVSALFDEFEKDRDSSTFIAFDRTNEGEEDKSRILFTIGGSDGESSDESENESKDGDLEEDSVIIPEGMFNESGKEHTKENDSNFKLLHDKNKFQRFAEIIDSTRYVHDEESPGCQIIFQNNRFSRKYRPEIEKFIAVLMERDAQDEERIPDLNLKSSTLTCVDINGKLDSSLRTSEMWEAHAIIGASQFHRECMIDKLGFPLTRNEPLLSYGWDIPAYEQVFFEALPVDKSADPLKPARPKQSCFNCEGDHRINECTQPKDFSRIRMNKQKFMQQSHMQRQSSQRYHEEGEKDPRFASFKPGVVSRELRKALDISSKELPEFIYRMRGLGYPPGWMQEALNKESGISIFDKDGNEVLVTGEMMEDGEIHDQLPDQAQIDPEKIIEYPGFTVPPAEGVKDEHEKYGYLPMQHIQLVTTLRNDLQEVSNSKKRKLEEVKESAKRRQKMVDDDMDIVEESPSPSVNGHVFVPPLPVDTPPSRPPLPQNTPPPTPPAPRLSLPRVAREISLTESERSESPSLEELEGQLKLLQEKLASSEGDADLQILDSCGASDDDSNSDLSELLALKERILKRTDSISSIQTFGELGSGGSCPGTPQPTTNNAAMNSFGSVPSASISKDFGTPIVKGPIELLPDSSKFGDGIEDHIPYENLPDATGTYDKIRDLISRVRTIKKKKKKID
ncbi:zinc finger CCHC domain-containing protein 8 [Magallana gigas]|uniref:zinc finger CCHC domain-containing protein 8 n=1 Tax=Magallana gigas TaxID=29159 RepID=UPI00333FF264